MSVSTPLLSLRATLSGRWQVPALALGLLVFAASMASMVRGHHDTTFQEQLAFIAALREARAHERASAYIMDQMKKPLRPAEQRGKLARQLAEVIYDVESELVEHRRDNARAIVSNLHTAENNGVKLDGEDWVKLGDAYRWSDNSGEAADAYRQALRLSARAPDRLRRRIVELDTATKAREGGAVALSPEALALIEEMLLSDETSPPNYYWALDRQVERLLDKSENKGAMTWVQAGRQRLTGTEELMGVCYLEAQCLLQAGRRDEAEAVLRSLRDDWTSRDELWGKAGWLLGKIQQEDDRPQLALASYEEVLKSFRTGGLLDGCEVGRAECLAALGRHEASLHEFQGLAERVASVIPNRYVDRDAVRSSVATIGESLLVAKSLELGTSFLELALQWSAPKHQAERVHYISRLAESYGQMARLADPESEKGRSLHAKSAEMNLALAEQPDADEVFVARVLDQGTADLEAAGRRAQLIEVLDRYAAKHPDGLWRSTALFKLGRACQAEHRYSEAITAYQDVINTYPRTPDALRSVVPLARSLLAAGKSDKAGGVGLRLRGVDLLLSIVADRGKEQLFAPSASEYVEALFELASYYSTASDAEQPDRFELAIARWEQWLALYPEDSRNVRAHFLLADAYRHSAEKLSEEITNKVAETDRRDLQRESNKRLEKARENYDFVVMALAPLNASALDGPNASYLRAGYLYRADCLFDLARYESALEAYREAAWRYEDQPVAVNASVQVVHCHERLGQTTEANVALARAKWLLAKIPASVFLAEQGVPQKDFFQAMLERIEKSGLY